MDYITTNIAGLIASCPHGNLCGFEFTPCRLNVRIYFDKRSLTMRNTYDRCVFVFRRTHDNKLRDVFYITLRGSHVGGILLSAPYQESVSRALLSFIRSINDIDLIYLDPMISHISGVPQNIDRQTLEKLLASRGTRPLDVYGHAKVQG